VKPSNSLSMHIAISNTLTCSVIRHPSGMLGIKSLKNMKRNLSPLAAHWRLHSICPSPFLGPVDHPCPPQLTLAALPARSPVSASCPWVCAPPRLAWIKPTKPMHCSVRYRMLDSAIPGSSRTVVGEIDEASGRGESGSVDPDWRLQALRLWLFGPFM
jgi:hypothetical protein